MLKGHIDIMALTHHSLKIGYVPLIDSAPLLVAEHEGFFLDEGVRVTLSEEVGWATVRDKLIHNELDMASTIIGLPYAMHNGVGCFQTEVAIPLIINANGNTVCLSRDIPEESLQSPETLAQALNARVGDSGRKWTFATVNPYSTHLIMLFRWLSQYLKGYIGEIDIVFCPPQLAPQLLEEGMIDGFCAGEPWGSIAEGTKAGRTVATSIDLNENHPEKVLTVPSATLEFKRDAVTAACRAIYRALPLCDAADYQATLCKVLAAKPALGMTAKMVKQCLQRTQPNSAGIAVPLHKFSGDNINEPTHEKEAWVIKGLKEAGLFRKKVIATGKLMQPEILF